MKATVFVNNFNEFNQQIWNTILIIISLQKNEMKTDCAAFWMTVEDFFFQLFKLGYRIIRMRLN